MAGVSFVVGAVQYLFSLENEATKKDARSRMFASIFGLIICLASILILNQINPEIAKLNFGEPTGKKFPGIYYSNGNSDQDIPAPMSNSNILNTTEIQNLGYNKIAYYCGQSYQEPLLITFYPKKEFKDTDPLFNNTKVITLNCKENTPEEIDQGLLHGENTDIQGLSFDMAFQKEGVYFFLNDTCSGYRKLFTSNLSPISEPFYNNVKSVEVLGPMINFQSRSLSKWGVIFQGENDTWRTGSCTEPYEAYPGTTCLKVNNITPHSATIFYKEGKLAQTLNSTGVNFYSKPWGWETGSFAGYNNKNISTNDNDITLKSKLFFRPADVKFNYIACQGADDICEQQPYKNMCPTFEQCPGSVKLNGKHVMIISNVPDYGYRQPDYQGRPYDSNKASTCQIFYSNINSIKELEFTGKRNTIGSIKLIPIK